VSTRRSKKQNLMLIARHLAQSKSIQSNGPDKFQGPPFSVRVVGRAPDAEPEDLVSVHEPQPLQPFAQVSNDTPPLLQASFLLPENGGHLGVKMHANRADGLSRNGSVSGVWLPSRVLSVRYLEGADPRTRFARSEFFRM